MNLNKFKSIILILAILLLFSSCGKKAEMDTDTNFTSTAFDLQTEETQSPVETGQSAVDENNVILEVSGANCKAGTKNLDITVSVKNNPCILGLDFEVYYDDSVMTLIKSESLINSDGANFTTPAYYRNPTVFVWDFQDATWKNDEIILKLTFDVSNVAEKGDYVVGIKYSYGNIFDENGEPLSVSVKTGTIHISN